MSDVNNLQNSLYQTMEMFAKYNNENSKSTITIECKIAEIVDAGLKEYVVTYLGNSFTAHAVNDYSYTINDLVYVLVPDGDFTKNKIILGLASAGISSDTSDSETDKYYEVSDNLFYNRAYDFQMSSYRDTEENIFILSSDKQHGFTAFDDLFSDFLSHYRTLCLKCRIKTSFLAEQLNGQGNYGIVFTVPLQRKGENGENAISLVSYSIDTSNMLGDPYNFNEFIEQSLYFTIDEQYTYNPNTGYAPTITYFCKGFPQDSEKAEKIFDINFVDVSLHFVKEYPDTISKGYCLIVQALEGEDYVNQWYSENKTLTPKLYIDGKETSLDKSEIYWFQQDASIKTDSLNYSPLGGYGWSCLNEKIEENFISQKNIVIKKADVGKSCNYKCVVICGEKQLSTTINLRDLHAERYLKITSDNTIYIKEGGGYANLTVISRMPEITTRPSMIVKDYWIISDNYDNYTTVVFNEDGYDLDSGLQRLQNPTFDEDNGVYVSKYRYPVYKIEDGKTLICTSKYLLDNNEKLLASNSLYLYTSENSNCILNILNDNIVYKYDTAGVSPASSAYNGPLSCRINSLMALSYTLRKENGDLLTEEEYKQVYFKWTISKNSLFTINGWDKKTDYVLEGYGNTIQLSYGIENKYNVDYANGQIFLEVNYAGLSRYATAAILFTKEGESGTNGTEFVARLVYGGSGPDNSFTYGALDEYGLEKKLKLVYNVNDRNNIYYLQTNKNIETNEVVNKLIDTIGDARIFPLVFKNGNKIDSTQYSWDIEYSFFDNRNLKVPFSIVTNDSTKSASLSVKDDERLEIKEDGTGPCVILQGKVTIKENGNSTGTQQILYCYYPIDIILVDFDVSKINLKEIPSVDAGYPEIMYNTDGYNPSYDSDNPFVFNTYNYSNIVKNFYATNRFVEKEENNVIYIIPSNKYEDGQSRNYAYLKCSNEYGNFYYYRPIVLYFNRYTMNNINEWDGNKIYTGEDDTYLLSPQLGAGIKEKDNSFTGLVMGIRDTNNNTSSSQVGMFGYYQGIQSLFINAKNGSAIFGTKAISNETGVTDTSGQIIIDPTSNNAMLYSNNFWKEYNKDGLPKNYSKSNRNNEGMLIDLSTPSIEWGNGNFSVTKEGYLTAVGGGKIAGWNIADTLLYSEGAGTKGGVTLDSGASEASADNYDFAIGERYYKYGAGKIYSHNLKEWKEVPYNSLSKAINYRVLAKNNGFHLSKDGLSIGRYFSVDGEDGELRAGSGVIGYWNISNENGALWGKFGNNYAFIGNNNPTDNNEVATLFAIKPVFDRKGYDLWNVNGYGHMNFMTDDNAIGITMHTSYNSVTGISTPMATFTKSTLEINHTPDEAHPSIPNINTLNNQFDYSMWIHGGKVEFNDVDSFYINGIDVIAALKEGVGGLSLPELVDYEVVTL